MKPKISLITLGVQDIPRSKIFYETLGFEVESGDGEDFVMFKTANDTRLALFPVGKLAEDAGVGAEGLHTFEGITLAHNEPSKEQVDSAIQEFLAAGATVAKPAADTFWGGYSGYVRDLDGHLWEIAWNPFSDLT